MIPLDFLIAQIKVTITNVIIFLVINTSQQRMLLFMKMHPTNEIDSEFEFLINNPLETQVLFLNMSHRHTL